MNYSRLRKRVQALRRIGRRSAVNGFTSMRRSAVNGFTLVELMVVIAIIGFASAAVLLLMPDPRGRLVDDADHFAMRMAAARDHAIVSAQPVSLWVTPTAYGFEQKKDGQWVQMEDGPFRTIEWSRGIQAFADVKPIVGDVTAPNEWVDPTAQKSTQAGRLMIRFDSIGLPGDTGRLLLRRDEEEIAITLDGAGRVKVGG